MTDAILQARGLSKTFAGFSAVSNIDLDVERGSIHALIGPNGAGKTTVFNLLTRFITPSAGSIVYDGTDITRAKPTDIANRGMVRSFQISAIFPHLSVLDNVRVALQRHLGLSYHFWRSNKVLDSTNERAMALLKEVGLAEFAGTTAVELAYGRKRALEIATTLALDPKLMLLDEPTQGMSAEDVGKVTALIRQVAADRTILMVEHNLKVVSTLADKITVLNRGEILAEGPYAQVSKDPAVMEAYMGSAEVAHG
ncbi:branched chain amino acid ABC transporter ATPase [Salinisphaera shabanensis T35B1]|uniref:Branched-chain amino acid ABC transporter ATP-binding subunit protein n=1 Tax=Salinisphaera shabanensis E1L3A TaxID=1033802 RepID=F7Q914_9GAMM|nr:ABC transporter ATP-binding protein [Salinisphaera shabanensis]ERJ20016.1 Putative branched-chain amino acid ABC transporter ATP-binding subunit protein [Salinisphaera shabanensis E1L3A]